MSRASVPCSSSWPSSGPDRPGRWAREAPALTDEQKEKNLDSFEVVWKTIRDTHFDPKSAGSTGRRCMTS